MGKNSKHLRIDGKTYRVTLDKFLADKELTRKSIAKDGSCLFRAVSEQVYHSQSRHHLVRLKCVDYIGIHRDDFKEFITVPFEEYLSFLSKELWGGELELVVLSRLYSRSIIVYNEVNKAVQEQVFLSLQDEEKGCATDELENPILLAYSDGNHYDSVYSTQYMDNLSFCQGIVYTCLMEKVFKQTVTYNCKRKLRTLHESEANYLAKIDRDNPSALQAVQNRSHVLYSLWRYYQQQEVLAMSWTLYYNAALHVHRYEKQSIEQRDRSMAASIQFHVGNKCCFYIEGKRMTGEIAGLNVSPGIHMVQVNPRKERWEIPVKDLTLVSSHRKPHSQQYQSGEESGHAKSHGTPGGSSSTRSWQQKERSSHVPVSSADVVPPQSLLGPVPVTNKPSAPYGSMKKGRVSGKGANTQQYTERPQKQDGQKRRHGRNQSPVGGGHGSSVTPTEPTVQQGRNAKSKPKAVKTEQDFPPVPSNAALPGSAPPPPLSNPTKTVAPYSSVVKKTTGGPSGSLTSEGTEYDESSGEEAEEPSDSKFPDHHKQDAKSGKALPLNQDKPSKPSVPLGQGGVENSVYDKKPAGAQFIAHRSAGYQGSHNQLNSPENHDVTSVMAAKRKVESPYLERQLPQSTSSQPEDAWPLIDEDHKEVPLPTCTTIPSPEKTMLYAAAMTNRSNQKEQATPSTSSTHFPYSTTTTTTSHFTSPAFTNQHMTRVTSPPLAMPQGGGLYLPQAMPTSVPVGDMIHPGLANLLTTLPGIPYPGSVSTSPSNQHSSFQSKQLPPMVPSYIVRNYSGQVSTGGGEVYSNAGIPKASSTPQLGYSNSRPPRNVPTTSPLPYTTVAAGMTMRNMLGIDSGVQSTSTSIYTAESRKNYQATGYKVTSEQATQTPMAECVTQEVQVGAEVMAREVQTQGPDNNNTSTQTTGCYISVESLAPLEEVRMNCIADQLSFAVQYSLQCLSAFSQHSGSDSTRDIEASLKDLLATNQIEILSDQAAQVNSLSVSQQEFLKSVGGGVSGEQFAPTPPYLVGTFPNNQPPSPQSADSADPSTGGGDVIRNENVMPQQEQQQQLQSPPVPRRLDIRPNFPFLMPPRPPHFMMPHPHGGMQPMYYPIMAPMPVPAPMGYMPFIPPGMVPRQVAPPLPPQEPSTDEQGTYGTADNANHDTSMQGQLQGNDELDSDPQQQQQQPLPPPAQVQSSEMVASVYPIPPSAMAQPELPTDSEAGHNTACSGQIVNTLLGQHQIQQDSTESDHTVPPTPDKPVDSSTSAVEADVPVADIHVASPHHKQQQQQQQTPPSPAQGVTPQPKTQKTPRKLQKNSSTGTSNQPGLPCRPSSTPQGGAQQQSKKHSHHGGKAKNEGEGQRRNSAKSKSSGSFRGVGNRKTEQVDEQATASGDTKREPHVKKNRYKTPKKHGGSPAGDHTGSNTVSGTTSKSDQDPSRHFGRWRSTSSSTAGAQDTIDFRWSVPSPSSTSPGVIDSAHMMANPTPAAVGDQTEGNCQAEESEWPDFSELHSTGGGQVPTHGKDTRFAAMDGVFKGDMWDTPYLVEDQDCTDSDSIEDPFLPAPPFEVWSSDLGDYPLTLDLSPSQSQGVFLAQCTGNLGQKRTAHKH